MFSRLLVKSILLVVAAGCTTMPRTAPLPQNGVARTPEIFVHETTGERSVEISVLLYNVAGLPWPVSSRPCDRTVRISGERLPVYCPRSSALELIGDQLGAMRARGKEPDIVLLQEGFSAASAVIPERGGYPNWVLGPSRNDRTSKISDGVESSFVRERSFWKGEKLGKFTSSGLHVLSNFPILEAKSRPFKEYECAGYDCLANKGVLLVRIQIPGVPVPLEVTTTHMVPRKAAGVSESRTLRAHNLQVDEEFDFLSTHANVSLPSIWGGDYNMKNARDRLEYMEARYEEPFDEVSEYCSLNVDDCDVHVFWETEEPWLETQDLQGWYSGEWVEMRPVRVETLFDTPVDGRLLSDHVGLLVHYRLSWMPDEPATGAEAKPSRIGGTQIEEL